MRLMVFDRWGGFQGDLVGVTEATHEQEINDTDELDLTCQTPLSKGDRILWSDGRWHEHVVNEQDQEHRGSQEMEYACEASIQWLRYHHIRAFVMQSVTAEEALAHVLELTTWEVGEVEDFGTGDVILEQTDAYKAILEIAGVFGCEVRADIEVADSGVAHRRVSLVHELGGSYGARFEYGLDVSGVTKSVLADDVITACYGYGKSLDTETDGLKDRLWCYVEGTDEQRARWGMPDGRGGIAHAEGMFEDSQIEDETELETATRAYLAEHSVPSVTYKVKDARAMQLRGVRLGDVVQVVDTEFVPELRIQARVGELKRDLMTGETTTATFGTVTSILPDVLTRIYRQVAEIAPAVTQAEEAAAQAARAESKATSIDEMLASGALTIGGSVLSVTGGRIYLDGQELATKGDGA